MFEAIEGTLQFAAARRAVFPHLLVNPAPEWVHPPAPATKSCGGDTLLGWL
jgi:hypothetical protein